MFDRKFKKEVDNVIRFDRNYDTCNVRNMNSNHTNYSKSKSKERGYDVDLKQIDRKIGGKIIKIFKLLFSANCRQPK